MRFKNLLMKMINQNKNKHEGFFMGNNKVNVKDLIQQMREEILAEHDEKNFKDLLHSSKKEANKKKVKVNKPFLKTLKIKKMVVKVRVNDTNKVKKRVKKAKMKKKIYKKILTKLFGSKNVVVGK